MILARKQVDYNLPPETVQTPASLSPKKTFHRLPIKRKLALVAMVLCCFVMGIMVAFYYAQVAYLGYKIDTLQHKMVDLRLESHNLDREITQITSLAQIEAIAKEELGMIRPNSEKVVAVAAISFPEKSLAPNQHQQTGDTSMPEEAEKQQVPRNEIIQAFAEMVGR